MASTEKRRYSPATRNGKTQQVRDLAILRADIVEFLRTTGPLPKKRIIVAMRTVSRIVQSALGSAEAAGEVESFKALSSRGRMDELWCVAGDAPTRQAYKFRGAEILAALQAAAARTDRTTRDTK
ncbi:hypothetical protein [Paraburkholderia tropica]|uniref:hypothetical protein n=1 Tax=Paraburkholderia tropica TaxID=92647 RepID=UPI001CC5B10F|nr:hypothetical protein [Paraburkholderia tropica]